MVQFVQATRSARTILVPMRIATMGLNDAVSGRFSMTKLCTLLFSSC
jgi:hypothetical protein